MARNYKRDLRGRFAKVAGSYTAKKRKQQKFRVAKATNRAHAQKAVEMGLLTKQQGEIARKRADGRAKMEYKGYKVANEYTYRGDSRGRKRANGQYEYKRTEYIKVKK